MRSLLIPICLLFAAVSILRAEEKPDPRENLDTAIPEAIRLLEKKDYEGLIKAFVPPDQLAKLTADESLAEFAKSFGEKKAEILLKVLTAVKGTTPKLSEDKSIAKFELKEPVEAKRDIRFQKIDKYWYIMN